jgi:hypothetical protein
VDTLGGVVDNSDVARWDAEDEARTKSNRTTKAELRRRKQTADRLGFAPAIDYKAEFHEGRRLKGRMQDYVEHRKRLERFYKV